MRRVDYQSGEREEGDCDAEGANLHVASVNRRGWSIHRSQPDPGDTGSCSSMQATAAVTMRIVPPPMMVATVADQVGS